MPTMATTGWVRRWAPEIALAALAAAVFLGCLGSVDLWGKREQRASAEAIDTIVEGRWLIAQIQGRPRLEKPPLPRWTIASLMELTGRRDEWIVRLPSAASALGIVALTYALGRRMSGRSAGLAAALILTSSAFFIAELRQAGNDGPLAFFVTLALYAAWRRIHAPGPEGEPDLAPGQGPPGSRGWSLLMYLAMGLGFLTKGPIVLIVAAIALVPYLATAGRLRRDLRLLVDGRGILLFALLALSWPVPVLLSDPKAIDVWYLEMAQKAGTAGIRHHRHRSILAVEWPWMTAPWGLIGLAAVARQLTPRGRAEKSTIWFAWWWAVGNLAMFCFWKVAKPNYYLPCLPGVALLAGVEWIRIARAARGESLGARRLLQAHFVIPFAVAMVAPVAVTQLAPQYRVEVMAISLAMGLGALGGAWAWRRGADVGALYPMVSAMAAGILIGYGSIAPRDDDLHSHRALAATLGRILPPEARTIMFFHELDEGLWFYLRDRTLVPVPRSQPEYNEAYGLVDALRSKSLVRDPQLRLDIQKQKLVDWIRDDHRGSDYVLIRNKLYDQFAADLVGLVTPVYRERDLKRNELVLLRVDARLDTGAVASGPESPLHR